MTVDHKIGTLAHAVRFDAHAVASRLTWEENPILQDARTDIYWEINQMHQLIAEWDTADGYRYQTARNRLKAEMEYRVDAILLRSFRRLDDRERGVIALIFWERNSSNYKEVLATLPGGENFFLADAEVSLKEEIDFRVTRLKQLIAQKFDGFVYVEYVDRIGLGRSGCLRRIKALACAQDTADRTVTLYFDNEEDAVYAKCFV